MELITISRLKAFRRCPRLHYYRYEIGRRPIRTSEALGFGTLFHAGLESWWLCWQDIQQGKTLDESMPLTLAYAAMSAKFAGVSEEAGLASYDMVKAEELMRGYHFRWLEAMDDIEVIAVESQFKARLVNPMTGRYSQNFMLGGKLDARVRLRSSNEFKMVEHKTSTMDIEPGSTYWDRLRMDGQISMYTDGARSLGDDIVGCIYDVAKRPTIRPKTATLPEKRKYLKKASKLKDGTIRPVGSLIATQRESDETCAEYRIRLRGLIAENPNTYYQRGDIVRMDGEMDEFRYDTWVCSKGIREHQLATPKMAEHAWPRNDGACHQWNRPCEYWLVCGDRSLSIDDDTEFRSSPVQHEELA